MKGYLVDRSIFKITAYEVGIFWNLEWYWSAPKTKEAAIASRAEYQARYPNSVALIRAVRVTSL